MRKTTLALALAATAGGLAAQPDHFTTSPEGYDYSEGESDSRDLLGTEPRLRFQQIDATNLQDMPGRSRIAFRRDGRLPDNFDYGSRTIEIEVVLSESDVTNISTTFAANYKTNTTTVFDRKKVSFDDWTFAPTVLPDGTSTVLLLDRLWSYAGKPAAGTDFLWEVKVYSNTSAGKDYPFDVGYVVPNAQFGNTTPQVNAGQRLSVGCSVAGGASPFTLAMTLANDGQRFTWSSNTYYGAAGAPVALLVDGRDQNLQLPSLCAPAHALLATIPHGSGNANGSSSFTFSLARNRALFGAELFAQAVTPDTTQSGLPVALSGGLKVSVPADPPEPKVGRLWALDPSATTATVGPVPGGIIIWTNHN